MDYKNTLNLPKTKFSMKADLASREPVMLKAWEKADLYAGIRRRRAGKKRFILHDGPPYANGRIHMGHVLNKILKDIVVKYVTLRGYDSPFVPGWDCHGLPVEHQLFKELDLKKGGIDQVAFRKKAREYAMKYVAIQRDEFKRLGIFGDWEKPYLTLDAGYEAGILRAFADLARKGYIYKDKKPVNWCTVCETALAEAEVEYENHRSPSVYVKFAGSPGNEPDTYFIIWTTTPWTLLANVAIAVHPDLEYAVVQTGSEKWIMASGLVDSVMKKAGREGYSILSKMKGRDLENSTAAHPFIDRKSRVVLADYVSSEEGTGCVHTAPGHGMDDYMTGRKYGLDIIMPVNGKGVFDSTCGEFSGMDVREANGKIIDRMKKDSSLVYSEHITHSYPHCWRCKKPIIFRATEQWFMNVDHDGLRQKLLGVIEKDVRWHPQSGMARIRAMVSNRPDWCLSRQRYWGVPIPAFSCVRCGSQIIDADLIQKLADLVEREG
ncbi:MAG: class I tRNA ligase family protein, partial [Candidatus Omnitrophota bacterium]